MSSRNQCDYEFDGSINSGKTNHSANIRHKLNCSCKECNPNISEEEDTLQLDHHLYASLNAIVLQYFDCCGLHSSYKEFYKECQRLGMPNFQDVPQKPKSSRNCTICFADVQELMAYFDNQEATALLKKWESIRLSIPVERMLEAEKIDIYIRIYITLIPFHQNFSRQDKSQAMSSLLEYFQSKTRTTKDTDDEEILSFYALPFVKNPDSHPVFSKFFKKSWTDKLRSRLEKFFISLCQPKEIRNPKLTDLATLYDICSKGTLHTVMMKDGSTCDLLTCPSPGNLISCGSIMQQKKVPSQDLPVGRFFQNINDLAEQAQRLERSHSRLEKKYTRQIHLCDALVTCLQELLEGKSMDDVELQKRICSVYPHPQLVEPFTAIGERGSKGDFITGDRRKKMESLIQEIGKQSKSVNNKPQRLVNPLVNPLQKTFFGGLNDSHLTKSKKYMRTKLKKESDTAEQQVSHSGFSSPCSGGESREIKSGKCSNANSGRTHSPYTHSERSNIYSERSINDNYGGENHNSCCSADRLNSSKSSFQSNLELRTNESSSRSICSSGCCLPPTYPEDENTYFKANCKNTSPNNSGRRTYRVRYNNDDDQDINNYSQNVSSRTPR